MFIVVKETTESWLCCFVVPRQALVERHRLCALWRRVLCKELLFVVGGAPGNDSSATGWKLVKALATGCSGRCPKTAKSRFQARLERVTTALQKKNQGHRQMARFLCTCNATTFKMLLLRIHRKAQLASPEPFDPHGPEDANLPRSNPKGIMMTHG